MFIGMAGNKLILGLSKINLERLQENKPIEVDLARFGGQGSVFIFYGETEAKMGEMMSEFIRPSTDVYVDPKLKQ